MENKYKRLKLACYSVNVTMSTVGNMTPILFLTFRSMYEISYSLLGLLVLINFSTQLIIDLIFSFYSHKFNIPLVVKSMPIISIAGFILYAAAPIFFPNSVYIGLAVGTVIFSVASGLAEVLISPIIAEIPAENPEREMSRLHSVYAWGVVGIVIFATLFLLVFGYDKWQMLAVVFAIVPLISFILFSGTEIPEMKTQERVSGTVDFIKNKGVWLCVSAIFLGGASECTMAQWVSGYLEMALGIPKLLGDVFGVALFGVALGIGRSLYAKIGSNISRALYLGAIGAAVCYFIAAVTPFALLGLIACGLTGFCVSMLWPGSLVVASERFPNGGVLIFALMAAGGDMGASIGPQLVGIVTDWVLKGSVFTELARSLSITAEQLGMKAGMLVGMIFPILAIFVYSKIRRTRVIE